MFGGAGLFMCLFSRHSETFLCVPFDPSAFLAVRFVRGGPGEDWRGWKREIVWALGLTDGDEKVGGISKVVIGTVQWINLFLLQNL